MPKKIHVLFEWPLKYAQLLRCALYAVVHQKEQNKSTGAKGAHKKMIKLNPGQQSARLVCYKYPNNLFRLLKLGNAQLSHKK